MYCPECGIEERQANQFCRACGIDMRRVRVAVESPDSITASAVSARDEIGRAAAAKIRESQSPEELAMVAENVLPEVEKFLESPEPPYLFVAFRKSTAFPLGEKSPFCFSRLGSRSNCIGNIPGGFRLS